MVIKVAVWLGSLFKKKQYILWLVPMIELKCSLSVERLTFEDLEYYWVKGCRNGRLYRLKRMERGFYRACMLFAKLKKVIVSETVVTMLNRIIERLMPLKEKAFKEGGRRIEELKAYFNRSGVFKWASRVLEWLTDKTYIMYLGFMEIYSPPRFAW